MQTFAGASSNLHDVIQHREIHRLGEKVFADAFDLVRVRLWHGAGLEVVIEDGPHGVDANHPQSRMTLLQKLSGAGDRAARAHAGHHDVETSAGLPPDLRASAVVVRVRVGRVGVLVGVEAVGCFFGDAAADVVVTARILGGHRGGSDDHARAEGPQQANLLFGHLIRHDEDSAISAHRRGNGHADAGIPGCRLYNRAPRPQQTAALGVFDHRRANTVFHRAAGVQILQLGDQIGADAPGDFVESNQRRPADDLQDRIVDLLGRGGHSRPAQPGCRHSPPHAPGRWGFHFPRHALAPTSCHRGNDRYLVAILDRRGEPFELADLGPIDENVDEAAHLPRLVTQLLADPRICALQGIQQGAHAAAGGLHLALAARCTA